MSDWITTHELSELLAGAGVGLDDRVDVVARWCLTQGLKASGFRRVYLHPVGLSPGTQVEFPEFRTRDLTNLRLWRVIRRRHRSTAVWVHVDWTAGTWAVEIEGEFSEAYESMLFDRLMAEILTRSHAGRASPRGRGRPIGTGYPTDDALVLKCIAAMERGEYGSANAAATAIAFETGGKSEATDIRRIAAKVRAIVRARSSVE